MQRFSLRDLAKGAKPLSVPQEGTSHTPAEKRSPMQEQAPKASASAQIQSSLQPAAPEPVKAPAPAAEAPSDLNGQKQNQGSRSADAEGPRPGHPQSPQRQSNQNGNKPKGQNGAQNQKISTPSHHNGQAQSQSANGAKATGKGDFSIEAMRHILLDMGVKPNHVNVAMRRAQRTNESLAQIMRDFGFLSGEGVAQAVGRQTNMSYFPAENVDKINKADLEGIELPEFKRFVPVGRDETGALVLAVPDATIVNEARNSFHSERTSIVIASEHTVQTVYRKYFANTESVFDAAIAKFEEQASRNRRKEDDDQSIGLVRDLYFALLRHACYSGASDLYLYRSEYVGIVRLKVNGVGQIFRTIDVELYNRLLNKLVQDNVKADDLRVKPKEAVLEFSDEERKKHSDIAERFGFRLELTESRGERGAVIRILDKNAAATDLERLGFDDFTYETITRVSRTATGFFLVTGPTGSGKTTTLYAVLKSIDAVERSIQSIENPVEYRHGLWQQFELRKDATDEGVEYNEWLKALLRNAPDVILVGEVRDRNVANICLSAANTGHLVFATLHTNDAVMAVARLKSLEIDLDVLGSVLLGILAQRLLRVLCNDCKEPDNSPAVQKALEEPYLPDRGAYKPYKAGQGCANCDFTGYRGRRMIYEILEMNAKVREALEQGAPPTVISKAGMKQERTMWATGLKLVSEGSTSLEELMRVATKNF